MEKAIPTPSDYTYIFEDEFDCAIANDTKMNDSLDQIRNGENIDFPENDGNDRIDINVDYTDEIHTADMIDIDADDYIAAERDIATDPFGDDEIFDAVEAISNE